MTISVEEASGQLAELLKELPNGPITLTDGERTVARIVSAEPVAISKSIRQLGTMRGSVLYMAPDFNETPPGFEEYMP